MSKDITKILEGWDYDPEEVVVRTIIGDDGKEKIQLRLDLGLLQMEIDGRPDGQRPMGYPSWLDYYEAEERRARSKGETFHLDDLAIARLWQEGIQYYHRYLSFWYLKRYDLCARDTARNLRLFAFVRRSAVDERQVWQFDQFRPYVLMMNARALATPLLEAGKRDEALRTIDAAIEAIRHFLEQYGLEDQADQWTELKNLEEWREEILEGAESAAGGSPVATRIALLQRRLQQAVAAEAFEEAALIRDEIRRLLQEDRSGSSKE